LQSEERLVTIEVEVTDLSRIKAYIEDLQRRRVFRTAAVYVASMWIIVQGAIDLFPVFDLPNWMLKLIVIAAIAGLPVVLILSFAYQFTSRGLVRDEGESAGRARSGHRFDFVVIAALAAIAVFLVLRTQWTGMEEEAVAVIPPSPNSIAVLPFENMSGVEDNEYFSDGLSEELLNVLANIEGLEVASRTSSFAFKNTSADIPTVGQKLRVAYVLEGSVRRSENTVRITAQLIDALTDKHVWSETYDRELREIFAIQDEIAGAIANRTMPTLMAARGSGMTTRGSGMSPRGGGAPPVNVDAYDLYLHGLASARQEGDEAKQKARELFEQALELDPRLDRARAALANLD